MDEQTHNNIEIAESAPASPRLQRRWRQHSLRLLLVAVLVGAILSGWLLIWTQRKSPLADDITMKPITVVASEESAWREPWSLCVKSTGEARLTIGMSSQRTRSFTVSTDQLDHLRETLIRERYFDLGGEYGETVVDGSTHTLIITVGDVTKTVRLDFLMNWVYYDRAKLREPARAVRVWMLIREWFHDSDVADLRKYDQMVVDAADK
jgi:hypothetical protein